MFDSEKLIAAKFNEYFVNSITKLLIEIHTNEKNKETCITTINVSKNRSRRFVNYQ